MGLYFLDASSKDYSDEVHELIDSVKVKFIPVLPQYNEAEFEPLKEMFFWTYHLADSVRCSSLFYHGVTVP